MENFSSATAPTNPIVGQLWWDSTGRHLNVWQGTNWKVISSSMTGSTAPQNPVVGDFWWNTDSQQLYAYDGVSNFILIGPQSVPGAGRTDWESMSLLDDQNNRHAVMVGYVDGKNGAFVSVGVTQGLRDVMYNCIDFKYLLSQAA